MKDQPGDRTKPIARRKKFIVIGWVLCVVLVVACGVSFTQGFTTGLIISLVIFFVFRSFIFVDFRRNLQDTALQQNGTRAMATVTSFNLYRGIRYRVMGMNRIQMYSAELELEVHPSDQPKYTAKTIGVFSKTDYRDLAPGLVLTVMFDPTDPQKVAIADKQ